MKPRLGATVLAIVALAGTATAGPAKTARPSLAVTDVTLIDSPGAGLSWSCW